MKSKYFKLNKDYFKFINKNKDKIKVKSVLYTNNKSIKLIYV